MAGNQIQATDAKGGSSTKAYDPRGRRTSSLDRNGSLTVWAYDLNSNLLALTDGENQTTTYTYDLANRRLSEKYPDHVANSAPGDIGYGIVAFTYAAARQLLLRTDQLGDTCTTTYDLAGRRSSRAYRTRLNSPSGAIADTDAFTYDSASRLVSAASGRYNNTVAFTFDNAGRKSTESLTISGQTYMITTGYDADSRISSLTYPDGTIVTRGYTDRNQLNQLTYAGTVVDTRMYDNGKRMIGSTYNNGVGETRTYKADNTLAAINFSGAPIGNLSYSWDANKNKTAEAIGGTMSGYGFTIPTGGYDTEDRLVNFTRTDGALAQSWNLSPVGDWNSVTTNSVAQNRTHEPTHELTAINSVAILHDSKGNLVQNSNGDIFTWDFDNRLQGANTDGQPGNEVSYKWDALGRRILRADGATATVFIPSGQQTIADYPSGTLPTSPTYNYVYATYIDEPILRHQPATSTTLYYHRNQQYSIVALTSSTATIIERYAYTAYGAPTITSSAGTILPTSAISNRITYTAREYDAALRLYHYRARMYDANLGRFCGRDPILYVGSTWNLFEYVAGMPMNTVDPLGTVPISCACSSIATTMDNIEVYEYNVTVDCKGFASTCCKNACSGGWDGQFEIVGQSPDDIGEGPWEAALGGAWCVQECVNKFEGDVLAAIAGSATLGTYTYAFSTIPSKGVGTLSPNPSRISLWITNGMECCPTAAEQLKLERNAVRAIRRSLMAAKIPPGLAKVLSVSMRAANKACGIIAIIELPIYAYCSQRCLTKGSVNF